MSAEIGYRVDPSASAVGTSLQRWAVGLLVMCWSHGAGAWTASHVEIWLASTPKCNTCNIYELAARTRGYGKDLMYVHGSARLRIPIRHVDKASLPLGILQQLHGDSVPDSKYSFSSKWRRPQVIRLHLEFPRAALRA